MKTVVLKNGAEEMQPIVATVTLSLKTLWEGGLDGMLAVIDLHAICSGTQSDSMYMDKLQSFSLVQADGRVHDSIKNVVLSSIEGEGFEAVLVSPVAS